MPGPKDHARNEPKVEFPVTTMERARNGAFIGRADLLEKLANATSLQKLNRMDTLASGYSTSAESSGSRLPSAAPTVCVLHGLGGIGKTQLAVEYYYQHRDLDEYDACFWIEAEHDWTMASSFAKIAEKLGLLKSTDENGHEEQSKAIEESRTWLQTTGTQRPTLPLFC